MGRQLISVCACNGSPVRLPAVAVLGSHARGCGAPGAPDSAVDPALAGIFAQVRENADRFRMLLEAYPFRYRRLETVVLRSDPGEDSTLSVDTTEYESRARHPYRVGHVVYVDKDSHGHPVRLMYLPSFRDLADSTFLGTHCFQYAGTESLGPMHTTPGLRIDFRPADSIRAPDVAGSIYLDSASLIIRKAVFRLVNARALHLSALGLTVTTTYRQIARLVPVIDSVTTEEPLTPVTEMVARRRDRWRPSPTDVGAADRNRTSVPSVVRVRAEHPRRRRAVRDPSHATGNFGERYGSSTPRVD